MKQFERILVSCGNEEVNLSDIADMLGWKNSAAASTINVLVEKGYLRKTRYGHYIATKTGQEKIKETLDKEQNPYGDIDSVAYRTAALFTTTSRFNIVKTLKYEQKPLEPTSTTKELGDIIKKIYIESIPQNDCVDNEYIKSVWRTHTSTVCEECSFNFEKAYQKYEKELNKIETIRQITKSRIFKNLRWESYPDIEKYKRNFGLKTTYNLSDIPESWGF